VLTPLTRRLFAAAGIGLGMRVLDVGSGAGEVAFLAAELVGEEGCVVGVDHDPGVVEVARRHARAAGLANVSFHEGDFRTLPVETPFDAVVGRLILMYQPDPVASLGALLPHLRPGGLVVCHEPDLSAPIVVPPRSLLTAALGWLTETAARTGGETRMGPKLYPAFLAAGLPAPAMLAEAVIGGGVTFPGYALWADLVRAILPAMERHGIATAAEVEIETLADRLCAEVVAGGGCIATPTFVGAWSRKR
jgi:SAM-dependent methyltransferase